MAVWRVAIGPRACRISCTAASAVSRIACPASPKRASLPKHIRCLGCKGRRCRSTVSIVKAGAWPLLGMRSRKGAARRFVCCTDFAGPACACRTQHLVARCPRPRAFKSTSKPTPVFAGFRLHSCLGTRPRSVLPGAQTPNLERFQPPHRAGCVPHAPRTACKPQRRYGLSMFSPAAPSGVQNPFPQRFAPCHTARGARNILYRCPVQTLANMVY